MAENVLEKIINKKIEKIVNLKKTISVESLDELINVNKTLKCFLVYPYPLISINMYIIHCITVMGVVNYTISDNVLG